MLFVVLIFGLPLLVQLALAQSAQRHTKRAQQKYRAPGDLNAGATPRGTQASPRQPNLLLRVFQRMAPIDPGPALKKVPGLALAKERTASSRGCAVVVGGPHAKYVTVRLDTPHYFSYNNVVAAEESENGQRLQVIYAIANATSRNVALLSSFLWPDRAPVQTSKGLQRQNTLQHFEVLHRLKRGILTVTILQAIVILHEAGHLNYALPNDTDMSVSMENTQRVIQACFPELLEPNLLNESIAQ